MSKVFRIFLIVLPLLFIVFALPVMGSYEWSHAVYNVTFINALGYLIDLGILFKLADYPQKRLSLFVLPVALFVYSFAAVIIFIFRLNYSVALFLAGFFFLIFFSSLYCLLIHHHKKLRIYYIPFGKAKDFTSTRHIKFKPLIKETIPRVRCDGVVVDFGSEFLSDGWQAFLSKCSLEGIPVYAYEQLHENITGRVDITHIIENDSGCLEPSKITLLAKRVIDLLFLAAFMPVIILMIVLIALIVWLEDRNSNPFFIQDRMGFRGKTFKLVKFRSMKNFDRSYQSEDEAYRITRIGKILRKYRLDEIPQFWNVLKGDMSLIGPRPESIHLATYYKKEVPFFDYRHIIRPGISGWAQVMQGYAVGLDEMNQKLAYDFYYIKHFSIWLDFLIWYKTIKTVVTGFGSR